MNQVRQLVLALQNYHSSRGTFPAGIVNDQDQLFRPRRLTWMMPNFSYLEQTALVGAFDTKGVGSNNYAAARSRHPGGVHVGRADGSARFATEDVDLEVWQTIGSINQGEVAELP